MIALLLTLATGRPAQLHAQLIGDTVPRKDDPDAGEVSYTVEVKGCDADPAGCFRRGKLLLEAKPDPATPPPATPPREHPGLTLVLGACEAGHLPACTYGAGVLDAGKHVQRDRFQAAWFAQRSCATAEPAACLIVGRWYWETGQYDALATLAPMQLVHACNGGLAEGCFLAGKFYAYLAGDEVKAAAYFERGCEGGSFGACGLLGYRLFYGLGTDQNRARARAMLDKSCTGLDLFGCLGFGFINVYDGLRGDAIHGVALLNYTCDRKDRQGCYFAGRAYQLGLGVSPDLHEAVKFYQRACELHESRACARLAYEHLSGRELAIDYRKGAEYAQSTCAIGEMEGCSILGALYEEGLGLHPDFDRAVQLYRMACRGGFKGGCLALERLKIPLHDHVERGCPSNFRYTRFDWCL